MKSVVLDSYALLSFLFNETGSEKVVELFERAAESPRPLLIAAPNWAEIRYMVEQKAGRTQWDKVRTSLLSLPIAIVPADQALAELAGEIKVSKRMALADCFAAALARQEKAELYTGDPEFRAIEKEIKIVWL
ncbi:MAG: type II toxin-antitoxin system VapC family toxin [Deltaproteobacteria bacterium]|nr:type II toxin-antitoxin system VapC family toxin [Deltaproteobacteria bacterium]